MARPDIRSAHPNDAFAMADLMERQVRKHVIKDCTPAGARVLLKSISPEAIVANMNAGYTYSVAETGGALFGLVGFKGVSHVHHLYVAEPLQKTGLGRRLWEAARDDVCMHGTAPPIFTTVSTLNAVGFFRRLGFQPTGPDEDREGVRLQPMRYVMLGGAAK